MATKPADVFVSFGITGDLAKVMTFRSLYRLERRGLLTCPIVGVAVDDWSVEDLREHARKAIKGTGEKLETKVNCVAKGSITETYAAARFEIDSWRWEGVPFFIRTGELLPVTQTEVRLIFDRPPRLGVRTWGRHEPQPDQRHGAQHHRGSRLPDPRVGPQRDGRPPARLAPARGSGGRVRARKAVGVPVRRRAAADRRRHRVSREPDRDPVMRGPR